VWDRPTKPEVTVGQEVKTTLRFDGRIHEGTALLETDSLIFRGPITLTVPFSEIFGVEASGGWLDLKTARGLLLLELGPKAETWAEKIKNPKALVEKLGVDGEKKVAVVGALDGDLRSDIEGTGAKVAKSARGKDYDVIFVAAERKADLERLGALREMIKSDGAIWIVYPKGREELRERDVLIAGRTLQLTDNKQVKVSEVLTAVRFVIPAGLRKKK
jgi:hypothetical protein